MLMLSMRNSDIMKRILEHAYLINPSILALKIRLINLSKQ